MIKRLLAARLAAKYKALEGRKFTHPWQPTKLNGWNSVCVAVAPHCVEASYNVPADQWLVLEPHKPGHVT